MASIRYDHFPDCPWLRLKTCDGMAQATRPHAHDHHCVALVTGGSSVVRFGGEAHAVGQGQLVFIGAGFVHQCLPDHVAGWRFRMVQVDAAWASDSGLPVPVRPCFLVRDLTHARRKQLLACFDALADDTADPEETVLDILGQALCADADAAVALHPPASAPDAMRAIARRLRERPDMPVRLQALAEQARTDRFSLIRTFRAHYGTTPMAWWNMQRLEEARRMLDAGHPILDIVHALGFSDQSHFSRLFKAHAGVSATQYRKSADGRLRHTSCGKRDRMAPTAHSREEGPSR